MNQIEECSNSEDIEKSPITDSLRSLLEKKEPALANVDIFGDIETVNFMIKALLDEDAVKSNGSLQKQIMYWRSVLLKENIDEKSIWLEFNKIQEKYLKLIHEICKNDYFNHMETCNFYDLYFATLESYTNGVYSARPRFDEIVDVNDSSPINLMWNHMRSYIENNKDYENVKEQIFSQWKISIWKPIFDEYNLMLDRLVKVLFDKAEIYQDRLAEIFAELTYILIETWQLPPILFDSQVWLMKSWNKYIVTNLGWLQSELPVMDIEEGDDIIIPGCWLAAMKTIFQIQDGTNKIILNDNNDFVVKVLKNFQEKVWNKNIEIIGWDLWSIKIEGEIWLIVLSLLHDAGVTEVEEFFEKNKDKIWENSEIIWYNVEKAKNQWAMWYKSLKKVIHKQGFEWWWKVRTLNNGTKWAFFNFKK